MKFKLSVSGFVKQYNVVVDPNRLRAQGISLNKLRDAIRSSNADVGALGLGAHDAEELLASARIVPARPRARPHRHIR